MTKIEQVYTEAGFKENVLKELKQFRCFTVKNFILNKVQHFEKYKSYTPKRHSTLFSTKFNVFKVDELK